MAAGELAAAAFGLEPVRQDATPMATSRDHSEQLVERRRPPARPDVVARPLDKQTTVIGPRLGKFTEPQGPLAEAGPLADRAMRAFHVPSPNPAIAAKAGHRRQMPRSPW